MKDLPMENNNPIVNADMLRMQDLIAEGMPPRQACEAVGIPRSQFASLMKNGQDDARCEINSPQALFYKSVVNGRQAFAEMAIAGIKSAGAKDWKAFAYLLERNSPEDYRTDIQQSDADDKVTIINDVVAVDDGETAVNSEGDEKEATEGENDEVKR